MFWNYLILATLIFAPSAVLANLNPAYCDRLLSLAASPTNGPGRVITEIADLYLKLLRESGANLISTQELRSILSSGRFFELQDGSSAKDHLQEALTTLEQAAKIAVPDPQSLLDELRSRLADYIEKREHTTDESNVNRQERKTMPFLKRVIKLPDFGGLHRTGVVALSPDGTHALVHQEVGVGNNATDYRFKFWIVDTTKDVDIPPILLAKDLPLPTHVISREAYQFSSDGATLAIHSPKGFTTVNLITGKPIEKIAVESRAEGPYFPPGGDRFIFRNQSNQWIVSSIDSFHKDVLPFPAGIEADTSSAFRHVTFSKDGSIAALAMSAMNPLGQHSYSVIFWNLASHQILDWMQASCAVTEINAISVDISQDNKKAVVQLHGPTVVRDLVQRKTLFELEASAQHRIGRTTFSPDSRQIVGIYGRKSGIYIEDFTLELWSAQDGKKVVREASKIHSLREHESQWYNIMFPRFSKDGSGLQLVNRNDHGNRGYSAYAKSLYRTSGGDLVATFSPFLRASQFHATPDASVVAEAGNEDEVVVWYVDKVLEQSHQGDL